MTNLKLKTIAKSLPDSFRKTPVPENDFNTFFKAVKNLTNRIDNSNEREGNTEIAIRDFLKNAYCNYDKYDIRKKDDIDLVLFNDNSNNSPACLFEVKSPNNYNEFCQINDINKKALQQLIYYFIKERALNNNEIKYLIVTNSIQWFLFDASLINRLFYDDKQFRAECLKFQNNQMTNSTTGEAYKYIAEKIDKVLKDIEFTYFDFNTLIDFKDNQKNESDLTHFYKILSPQFLLKKFDPNLSYGLNKAFYNELLYILGLEEKSDRKKTIERLPENKRNPASLLELTIRQIESKDMIYKIDNPKQFGEKKDEQIFNAALQLVIIWINRILFLKLLEGQLLSYHNNDDIFAFLSFKKIEGFDKLESLFFEILNKIPEDRYKDNKEKYKHIPYLNSSLFEQAKIEQDLVDISNLDNYKELPYYKNTVLKDKSDFKSNKEYKTLEYLLNFLDCFDFSTDSEEKIISESKSLIRANVLGLIFEKINGYKDGSFYTPGFITMYMCRETIRRAVIQKFNEEIEKTKSKNKPKIESISDIHAQIWVANLFTNQQANSIINSIKICDPAVGSGHFLVSALNELIVIKSELGILMDKNNRTITSYSINIEDDELIIKNKDNGNFFAYKVADNGHINEDIQRVQETLFKEKQLLIENCLFGVDINPNSVQICRLRLWIELLKNTFYKENMQLETLPNIDINIKAGNSLISRFDIKADLKRALRKSKWTIDGYRVAVATYRRAESKDEKRQMEKLISDIKSDFRSKISSNDPKIIRLDKLKTELARITTPDELFGLDAKGKKIWQKQVDNLSQNIEKLEKEVEEIKNNAIYQNAFEWRFEFPEVLNDEGDFVGFDVVIGNPPYIQMQKEAGALANSLQSMGYQTYSRMGDIYTIFIERGMQVLKHNALLCFIISNKWMRAGYGEATRRYLKDNTNTKVLIDIGGIKIFEEATVDTNIIITQKAISSGSTLVYSLDSNFKNTEKFYEHISENLYRSKSFNTDDSWIISTPEEEAIKEKIEKIGTPLKDWDISINYGIKTGYNEAFIINGEKRAELIEKDSKSEEIIKPLLRGRDIKRYKAEFADLWLIFIPWHFPLHKDVTISGYSKEAEKAFEKEYPAIFNHLLKYKDKLSARNKAETGIRYEWYALQRCAATYYEEFEKEIIVWQRITLEPRFVLTKNGQFPLDSMAFLSNLKGNHNFLLSILNCKIIKYWVQTNVHQYGSTGFRLSNQYVEKLPIPQLSEEEQKPFTDLVEQILAAKESDPQADTSEQEADIDRLVYKLYDLTEEEIAIVENSIK